MKRSDNTLDFRSQSLGFVLGYQENLFCRLNVRVHLPFLVKLKLMLANSYTSPCFIIAF